MSETKRKVPKLRFPGFTEDWEQRKFTYLLDKKEGIRRGPFGSALKKSSFVKESKYTVYEQQNAIYDRFDTRYNITKEKFDELHKFQLTPGDFIMSGAGTIGRISRVPNGIKPGVFNQALVRFKIDDTLVDSEYFLEWIRSEGMQKEFTKANPGSAMVNLVPMSEVKEWEVLLPAKGEQYKIGRLLSKISNLITLHQSKLENLKLKKKALLQKLFPKNGEQFPELRFPGFTDAWEQRKLDDIAQSKIGGGTPKTSNESFWNGDIPWIQSSDLTEGDIKNIRINKYISSEAVESSSAKIIDKGAITLVTRVGVGKLAVVDRDFTTSQDFLSLSGFDDCNVDFIAYQLYRLMQEKAKVLQGTSIKGITKNELLDQEILMPLDVKEQELINQVLSCSDKLITLHQRKLEHLQLQKKALLQQMFV